MKKLLILATAGLLVSGISMAEYHKGKKKSKGAKCCKKSSKCCSKDKAKTACL
ncbi:MAG: hypothetical protein ABIO04_06560 [Ferruginibacter sp.]